MNNLTEQQNLAIRAGPQTMPDVDLEQWERKHCCFVLWKDGEEGLQGGTLQDMWDILWDVYTYKRVAGHQLPRPSPYSSSTSNPDTISPS